MLIGSKAVFARQNVGDFLCEVSDILSRILVWSAMFKSNVEPITEHLFSGCRRPYDVLSQEQCKKIELSPIVYYEFGHKEFLMKVLSESLFLNLSGETSFTTDNTLLIDDSLEKGICNERKNNILVATWTYMKQKDDYLMGNSYRGSNI